MPALFCGRFFDDIIMIFHNAQDMRNFAPSFLKNSGYFKLIGKEVSRSRVQFLDIDVAIEHGRMTCQPSLRKVPVLLSVASCHPMHIHRNWPISMRKRVLQMSSRPDEAVGHVVYKYACAGADDYIPRVLSGELQVSPKCREYGPHLPKIVCSLRYHPAVAQAFYKALAYAPVPSKFKLQISPAWRNALSSTGGTCMAHTTDLANDLVNDAREGPREGASSLLSSHSLHAASGSRLSHINRLSHFFTFTHLCTHATARSS